MLVLLLFISLISLILFFFFFFNDTATTEIYTLSLHDALPISHGAAQGGRIGPAQDHAVHALWHGGARAGAVLRRRRCARQGRHDAHHRLAVPVHRDHHHDHRDHVSHVAPCADHRARRRPPPVGD